MTAETDFFVSYNKADRLWAMGIRTWLEEAGHSVVMQQGDFVPGSNFILEMNKAAQNAKRLIAVLSPEYLASEFTAPEWAAMFALDPTGKDRRLVPVRIRDCTITGLLSQIVYIDLVGLSYEKAAEAFLDGISGRNTKPSKPAPKTRSPNLTRKAKAPAQSIVGDGNFQAGRDINYNPKTNVKHVVEPGPENITQKQAKTILEKLTVLGERDELAGLGNTYGKWMNQFKNTFKITSYHLLLLEDYQKALSWIQQQKGMTRSKLRRTHNETWKNEHFTAIHTVRQKLGWTKDKLSDFSKTKGITSKPFTSLKELGERQLASLSAAIKREGKKNFPS